MIKWFKIRNLVKYFLLLSGLFIFFWINTNSGSEKPRYAEVPGWEQSKSRNLWDYVLPEENTTIREPRDFCKQKNFLVIAVCSHISNYGARQIIRETWGKTNEFNYGAFNEMHSHLQGRYLAPLQERLKFYSKYIFADGDYSKPIPATIPVRIVFVIGKMNRQDSLFQNVTDWHIAHEVEQYNDIVQVDFLESYNNLTLKTVLALKWASHKCPHQRAFLMKLDDDVFVNIPNLLHFLMGGTIPIYADTLTAHDAETVKVLSPRNQLHSFRNLLVGHLFCDVRPVSDGNDKWYMPKYMYPSDKYPSYLSGSAFLMTNDVVVKLYKAALTMPLMHLEDVFVTGIVASNVNIPRQHNPLIFYSHSDNMCHLKGAITRHRLKEAGLRKAFQFVSDVNKRCPPPWHFNILRLIVWLRNNNCG